MPIAASNSARLANAPISCAEKRCGESALDTIPLSVVMPNTGKVGGQGWVHCLNFAPQLFAQLRGIPPATHDQAQCLAAALVDGKIYMWHAIILNPVVPHIARY